MHIILDAYSAPSRSIDSRLNRHHGALRQRAVGRPGKPRCFVHLEPEAVTEAVTEKVAVTAPLNVAAGDSVGLSPRHPRPHSGDGSFVGDANDLVEGPLFVGRLPDDHRARHIGAIPARLGTKVQEEKVTAVDATLG